MEKIIHYCWFGKSKKSKLIKRCISSWKKYASDFKLIEWNENNFNIDDSPQYVREAYKAKKYAFVSDYVRFYVLKKYGGIYLDTDVELIRKLDFDILTVPFFGMEKSLEINPGLIVALEKNDEVCDFMIDSYNNSHFFADKYNITICQRIYAFFDIRGFARKDENQIIEKYHIFSSEYFSPLDEKTRKLCKTNNTFSIHWFNASWLSKKEKLAKHKFISTLIKIKNLIFRGKKHE